MIPQCLFASLSLRLCFSALLFPMVRSAFTHQKTTIDWAMEKFTRFWRLGLAGLPLTGGLIFVFSGHSRGQGGFCVLRAGHWSGKGCYDSIDVNELV